MSIPPSLNSPPIEPLSILPLHQQYPNQDGRSPIFLNAIYLFPPSPGPTTLATRVSTYIKSIGQTTPPCTWQREIIQNLLQKQYDETPNCVQIIGGDFNHHCWHNKSHPVTDTFLSKLQLVNAAFDIENMKSPSTPQTTTLMPIKFC